MVGLESVASLPVTEFGVVVLLALVLGLVVSRFGVSSSIGFILAGLFLGQQGIHYISGTGISSALGEIGLLAILFYLGLEVNLRKFKETGGIALVLALVEMAGAFAVGFIVSKLFGFGDLAAIIIGSMMVAASTVEAVKFMIDENLLRSLEARIAISILIVQDLFAVILVVFLSSLASNQSFNLTVFNALVFVIAMFFVVAKLSRPVLELLDSWGEQNKMILFALGMGLIVSYLGTFLGLSPILGAYFAGFALAETVYGEKIKHELSFFRELFILFFFVSFGTNVLLPTLPTLLAFVAILVAVYILLKVISYGFFGAAIGLNVPTSLAIGTIMIPIGEFGIIIASIAEKLNAPNCAALNSCFVGNPGELLSIAFSLTIITTVAGPFLFRNVDKISAAFLSIYPQRVRQRIEVVGDQIQGLERLLVSQAFQNQTAIKLKNMLSNLIVAISIVYISYVLRKQITLSFLKFIPSEISLAVLLLPLVVWPLYNFARDFQSLAKHVSLSIMLHSKRRIASATQFHETSADLVSSFIMFALGIVSIAVVYVHFPMLLAMVVPVAYTALAAVYFGKAVYKLIGHYSLMKFSRG